VLQLMLLSECSVCQLYLSMNQKQHVKDSRSCQGTEVPHIVGGKIRTGTFGPGVTSKYSVTSSVLWQECVARDIRN
jgi:hypothetical protein